MNLDNNSPNRLSSVKQIVLWMRCAVGVLDLREINLIMCDV